MAEQHNVRRSSHRGDGHPFAFIVATGRNNLYGSPTGTGGRDHDGLKFDSVGTERPLAASCGSGRSRSPKKWLAELAAKLADCFANWLAGIAAAATHEIGRFIQALVRSLNFHAHVPLDTSKYRSPVRPGSTICGL